MDVGCQVLMPWAAPIGTGQGPRNARALRELRERAPNTPLIVDAESPMPFRLRMGSVTRLYIICLYNSLLLNALVMSNVVKAADSAILIRGVDQS